MKIFVEAGEKKAGVDLQVGSPIGRVALFMVAFLLFLYIYSPGMFYDEINFHMDDLLDYGGKGQDCYLAGGRWGLALYREIFGGTAMRCSTLTAGLYLCAAVVLQIHLLRITRWLSALTYVGIYLSCTQFACTGMYLVMADAVALAVLLATVAVYAVRSDWGQWLSLLTAAVSLTLANGIYQVAVLVYASLYACAILADYLEGTRVTWRVLVRGATTGGIGLLLSVMVGRLALACVDVSPDVVSSVSEYQNRLSGIGLWAGLDHPARVVVFYFVLWSKLALGCAASVSLPGKLSILAHVACIMVLWRVPGMARSAKVVAVMLYGGVLYLPYILPVVFMRPCAMDEEVAQRMFLAAPVVLAFVWQQAFACMERVRPGTLWRRVSLCFLVFCCIFGAYRVDGMFKGMRAWSIGMNKELLRVDAYCARLAAAKGLDKKRVRTVIMWKGQLAGNDMFVSHPLVTNIHMPSVQEERDYRPLCDKMPLWPAEESVRWVSHDKLIVNFK